MDWPVLGAEVDLDSLSRLLYLGQTSEERGLLQDRKTDESHRGREAWLLPLAHKAAPVQLGFGMTSRPCFVGGRDYSSVLCFP